MNNWKPFWFEGNLFFGEVKSREDWEALLYLYSHHVTKDRILDCRQSPQVERPYFGFTRECIGLGTLREFFEANNMEP